MTYGASPRASIALVLGGRALAFLRGRDYVLPHDVDELALDVLRHRLVLSYEALADDVDADTHPHPRTARRAVPDVVLQHERRCHAGGRPLSPAMITATDRLLHRLEWRVVRRLDGRLQGGYRTAAAGQRPRLRRAARRTSKATTPGTSTGTSPPGWTSRTCASSTRTAS